jgi:hypothetical protein
MYFFSVKDLKRRNMILPKRMTARQVWLLRLRDLTGVSLRIRQGKPFISRVTMIVLAINAKI